jgi:hypothetical protein
LVSFIIRIIYLELLLVWFVDNVNYSISTLFSLFIHLIWKKTPEKEALFDHLK